jgi:hypothetical protein
MFHGKKPRNHLIQPGQFMGAECGFPQVRGRHTKAMSRDRYLNPPIFGG